MHQKKKKKNKSININQLQHYIKTLFNMVDFQKKANIFHPKK